METQISNGFMGIVNIEDKNDIYIVKKENYLNYLKDKGNQLLITPIKTINEQFMVLLFKNNTLINMHYIIENNTTTRKEISQFKDENPWLVMGKLIDLSNIEG